MTTQRCAVSACCLLVLAAHSSPDLIGGQCSESVEIHSARTVVLTECGPGEQIVDSVGLIRLPSVRLPSFRLCKDPRSIIRTGGDASSELARSEECSAAKLPVVIVLTVQHQDCRFSGMAAKMEVEDMRM